MSKLVSVIIPCFNAERWIAEAIDSCLQQTYPNLEILVIDDGSTDNSLEIIKSYGDKITWLTQPRSGGNHARNKGFALSQGEYIQFLDADDYILPEKIARQVDFLEHHQADIVYCDWRYQHHLPDGSSYLDKIEYPGEQEDILESLLANWWVAVAALFYTRKAVENSDGWDETLPVAQDRDFFLSAVMNGARVAYQPGCYAIYRRYGNLTVSTFSKPLWVECHCRVLEKMKTKLLQANQLTSNYRHAIAKCYFDLARESLFISYSSYRNLIGQALEIFPQFRGNSHRLIYRFLTRILGFRLTEVLTSRYLLLKKAWREKNLNSVQLGLQIRLLSVQNFKG